MKRIIAKILTFTALLLAAKSQAGTDTWSQLVGGNLSGSWEGAGVEHPLQQCESERHVDAVLCGRFRWRRQCDAQRLESRHNSSAGAGECGADVVRGRAGGLVDRPSSSNRIIENHNLNRDHEPV